MRLPVVLVLVTLALVGCGSSSGSSTSSSSPSSAPASAAAAPTSTVASGAPSSLATVKFLAHAGLAFGAFHRYIYKPLLAGEFKHLLLHKPAVLKAAAAAVFVVHEIQQAIAAAQGSALLGRLVAPLSTLGSGFTAALAKLRTGRFNTAEIVSANFAIESIEGTATTAGATIAEHVPSIP